MTWADQSKGQRNNKRMGGGGTNGLISSILSCRQNKAKHPRKDEMFITKKYKSRGAIY